MQSLFFMLMLSIVSATHITIYTTNFPPFSDDGKGYSLDYLNEIFLSVFGSYNTTTIIVNNNVDIFNEVRAYNDTNSNFSIGTAGITITGEREKLGNFLPSYFTSGFQLLVHHSNSFDEVAKRITVNFFLLASVFLIGVLFLISVLAPIAWFVEFKYCDDDQYPIFINYEARKNPQPLEICGKTLPSHVKVITSELLNAFEWTMWSICGIKTGYPNSLLGRQVHIVAKGLSKLLVLLAIASTTTVFTVSSSSEGISSFSDLKGHSVCTSVGSTGESYLEENNLGYRIIRFSTVQEMIDAFYQKECDAVVYDYPFLQRVIFEREEGKLVGEIFNQEQYGHFLSEK